MSKLKLTNLNYLIKQSKEEYESLYKAQIPTILVGSATCGNSAGALDVKSAMEKELKINNVDFKIVLVGCIGLCYAEPIVTIVKKGMPAIFYGNLTPELGVELVNSYILGDDPCIEHAIGFLGEESVIGIPRLFDTPFLRPQVRRILRNCGFIDPENIGHYLSQNGYQGLINSMGCDPDQIIEKLKESRLRGRGGAGFPTWLKWQLCLESEEDTKYIICNADEGDPGAFMNRSLLESDPHSVLEGFLIAAYTIRAKKGFIYCRAEYPLVLERLKYAIKEMESYGLLGKNILGSGFDFEIEIKEGAGAFVCGEETALIASIQGERGMPRTRPPFPTTSGLWGKSTVINNVETLASVALIMQSSPEKFAEHGLMKSKGTKTFSLVGKVKNPGLIEVPLGTTLRQVIYDIGGGIAKDGSFKAVQIGGPSGGCLPEEFLDTPIDYESIVISGAIMGSGGLVVMDQDTCMVDVASYFLKFTQNESCGKCVPCRLGTKQILDILKDITKGKGKSNDIDLLKELAEGIKAGSLCGLGQTSPNPVLTTIKFFKEEYEAHVDQNICPSLVCKDLINYQIIPDKCEGCMLCLKSCPANAIHGTKKEFHSIDRSSCIKCGVCFELCLRKCKAIKKISEAD